MILSEILNCIIDIIFPPKCIFCGKVLPVGTESRICTRCYFRLPFVQGRVCKICGKLLIIDRGIDKCFDCRNNKHYFVQAISVFHYKGVVREAIIRYKFFGKKMYGKTFAMLMAQKIKTMTNWPQFDIITYVPMHKKRFNERGYNQTKILAKYLSKKLKCKLENDILLKVKNTSSQSTLNKESRKRNLQKVFKVKNDNFIKDMTILLIDDIYTTGSTVDECAKVLSDGGARAVYVATIAIGIGIN